MSLTRKLSNIIVNATFRDNKLHEYVQLAIVREPSGDRLYRRASLGQVSFPCGRNKTAEEWDSEFGDWTAGRLVYSDEINDLSECYKLAKQACADRAKARKLIDSKESFAPVESFNIQALMSDSQTAADSEFRRVWTKRFACLT